MKIKKMAGALALTAALAMGTTPAFAAGVSENVDTFSSNGSTEVKAKVDTVNEAIRATVPLQVTVVFGGQNGSKILAPSAAAYQITNIGTDDIHLLGAEISELNSTFKTTAMGTEKGKDGTEGLYKVWNTEDEKYEALSAENHLCFTFETGTLEGDEFTPNFVTYLTKDHDITAAKANAAHNRIINNATLWPENVGLPIAQGESLPIQLGGAAYIGGTALSDGDLTDTLCTIKYTIGA